MASRIYSDFPERKMDKPAAAKGVFSPGGRSGSVSKPGASDTKPPYSGSSPSHMSGAGSPRIKNAMQGAGSKTRYK